MAEPLVSIILPTFHWPQVLRLAVDTVLSQSFRDFELLIVGDACTDETEAVVRSIGDSRVAWHNLPENTGNQAGPNNFGLSIARGKYTAYMHQDDLWLPAHLQLLVDAMETHGPELAHTLCLQISPTNDADVMLRMIMGLPGTGKLGADGRAIYTPALMHRTDRARAVGNWGDWRSLRKSVVADFIERVVGADGRVQSIHEISVVKFNSAERRNSYVEKPVHEQTRYLHLLRTDPGLIHRETLLALEHKQRGYVPLTVIGAMPNDAPPGWEIATYRRMRGLSGDPDAAQEGAFHWTAQTHEHVRSIGVHELEQWRGDFFRWSSPVSVFELALGVGEYEAKIELMRLRQVPEVNVLFNAVPVEVEAHKHTIRFRFRAERAGISQLTLITSAWCAPGDSRHLGLALREILIESQL